MKTPNSKLPFVSVVIPAHNEQKLIAKTLKSLKNQNYPKDRYEMIVVDNASTDKTAAIAAGWDAKVVFEAEKGVQHARQAGFMAARGEFIASTDADNILPKNWILALASELSSNENIVAVGGWFELKKGSIITKTAINKLSRPAIATFKILSRKHVLIGQNFMVKKDIFLKTKGFLDLKPMNEDLMLAQRLSKYGEIKLYYGKNWKVITSPRRWKDSFIMGSAPYVINAVSYAVSEKLLINDFKDIRGEKSKIKLPTKLIPISLLLVVFISAATIYATPAQAKFTPLRKNVAQKITNTKKNIERIYQSKDTLDEDLLFFR
ncbi:MAG: glycosyltransferase [Patescibacteria group bacterium]